MLTMAMSVTMELDTSLQEILLALSTAGKAIQPGKLGLGESWETMVERFDKLEAQGLVWRTSQRFYRLTEAGREIALSLWRGDEIANSPPKGSMPILNSVCVHCGEKGSVWLSKVGSGYRWVCGSCGHEQGSAR